MIEDSTNIQDEYFVHTIGNEICPHVWIPKYLGVGYWAQECSNCGRLIEKKIPGYNCPESENEMTYDSRPETHEHIDRVRHFLDRAGNNLGDRYIDHDASKLVEPELSAFDIATPKLANLTYGSVTYKQALEELGPALQHHFEHNDHHPEHYENGVRGMSLMALIEMLCDWRAASERVKQRTDDPEKVATFEDGLKFNQERFGYSDELAEILLNTARELEMI